MDYSKKPWVGEQSRFSEYTISEVAASPAGRNRGIFAALPCSGLFDEHHYA